MKKSITAILVSLAITPLYAINPSEPDEKVMIQLMNQHMKEFASLEHQYFGDQVNLRFYKYNPGKLLHLPNGLKLTYGQIIMFAGDMFGDPDHPISTCPENKRLECFNLQFYALAAGGEKKGCANPREQAKNIIKYHEEIEQQLNEWRAEGKEDWDFYAEYGSAMNKKLNRLTCGGSFITDYLPFGTYLKLAEVNFDHFLPNALIAYKAGHQVALETAQLAYQQKQNGNADKAEQLLEIAYAQNAFANHYLSDSFAAGHIRTPRREIDNQVHLPAIFNLFIANLMHNEDNRLGLNVVNEEGMSWVAYGDDYVFKKEAELQRFIILQTLQRSADSIYETFESGTIPINFSELRLVPMVEKIEQLNQTSPLFKVENGTVLKRKNINDPYNFEWEEDWNGLITLLEYEL